MKNKCTLLLTVLPTSYPPDGAFDHEKENNLIILSILDSPMITVQSKQNTKYT